MTKTAYGLIYKITNKINNKVYIGQTIQKNGFNARYEAKGKGIERVYNFYKSVIKYGTSYNKHLFSSIEKYGFDAFEVVEEFDVADSKEELDEKELYWIKYYKSTDKKYGYNSTIGGDGNKIGKSAYINSIGKNRKPIICLDTKEIFLTMRDAEKKTGIIVNVIRKNCEGKTEYAEMKKKGLKLKFRYINVGTTFKRPVICLTTQKTFLTILEASKYYDCDKGSIIRNCKGKMKSAGKHPITGEKLVWAYALDYLIEQEAI